MKYYNLWRANISILVLIFSRHIIIQLVLPVLVSYTHVSSRKYFLIMQNDRLRTSPQYSPHNKHEVSINYCLFFIDLDPCLNVKCTHYATCVAYGPLDARCECPKSCPTFEDLQCGSDGKTYTNMCFYKKHVCETKFNVTIVHPGACYRKYKQ